MINCPISGKPKISQWFGGNAADYQQYGMKGHNGIDFSVPIGTPVYAPCEGYVKIVDSGNAGYGKHIQIFSQPYKKDGTSRKITLAHLSQFKVQDGQFVSSRDLIALSGDTGFSTGPHLHMTYCLLDILKNVIDYSNGYLGALDLAPLINGKRASHILLWDISTFLS